MPSNAPAGLIEPTTAENNRAFARTLPDHRHTAEGGAYSRPKTVARLLEAENNE